MDNPFIRKVGMDLFQQNLQAYEPQDPLYEEYIDKKGRKKQRLREVPPGLSERDIKILKSVKRRAHHLDKGFSICGARFGWTFIIGLVPFIGDFSDAILGYTLVIRKSRKADIPEWLIRRMLFNAAVSTAVGFIPVAGDVVLAVWKANSRNAWLLEEFLRIRGAEYLKAHTVHTDDHAVIKPGAGLKAGEKVEGKKEGIFSSIFRKKEGNGKTTAVVEEKVLVREPVATPGGGEIIETKEKIIEKEVPIAEASKHTS